MKILRLVKGYWDIKSKFRNAHDSEQRENFSIPSDRQISNPTEDEVLAYMSHIYEEEPSIPNKTMMHGITSLTFTG